MKSHSQKILENWRAQPNPTRHQLLLPHSNKLHPESSRIISNICTKQCQRPASLVNFENTTEQTRRCVYNTLRETIESENNNPYENSVEMKKSFCKNCYETNSSKHETPLQSTFSRPSSSVFEKTENGCRKFSNIKLQDRKDRLHSSSSTCKHNSAKLSFRKASPDSLTNNYNSISSSGSWIDEQLSEKVVNLQAQTEILKKMNNVKKKLNIENYTM